MQAARLPMAAPAGDPDADQRFVLGRVSWKDYVILRDVLDDRPGVRMTYLEGTLEIMSPSRRHETIKTLFARLIEMWAVVRGVPLNGHGSTTYRSEATERGLEPDECYCLGTADKPVPDLAFEVMLGRGGLSKLAVYQGLGVPEVWIWRDDVITVHRLGKDGYTAQPTSTLLPDIDLALLASFMDAVDQSDAARRYFEAVKK